MSSSTSSMIRRCSPGRGGGTGTGKLVSEEPVRPGPITRSSLYQRSAAMSLDDVHLAMRGNLLVARMTGEVDLSNAEQLGLRGCADDSAGRGRRGGRSERARVYRQLRDLSDPRARSAFRRAWAGPDAGHPGGRAGQEDAQGSRRRAPAADRWGRRGRTALSTVAMTLASPGKDDQPKVRLISHRAYGFHSADALIAMIYLCCAGIQIALPHR